MVNRTYNAIIDAFNRLIEEKDFSKISVEMVMRKAGVSRATFYRYFKDKYDVMNANYRELCFHIFEYGQKNLAIFKNALGSTGFNSFSNYIYSYSYEMALAITKENRGGKGFTPIEELQVDVFCNGICAVYKRMVEQPYKITASEAADALYEMMPESLKHYWWK